MGRSPLEPVDPRMLKVFCPLWLYEAGESVYTWGDRLNVASRPGQRVPDCMHQLSFVVCLDHPSTSIELSAKCHLHRPSVSGLSPPPLPPTPSALHPDEMQYWHGTTASVTSPHSRQRSWSGEFPTWMGEKGGAQSQPSLPYSLPNGYLYLAEVGAPFRVMTPPPASTGSVSGRLACKRCCQGTSGTILIPCLAKGGLRGSSPKKELSCNETFPKQACSWC